MEFHEDGHLELYNLDRDIGESVNLAATEPDQAQKLHQLLVDWREQIQAPMPTKNDDSSSTTKKPKKARPAEQEPGNVPSS
jgi:hypothetical protein